MHSLNPQQKAAVTETERPLLVLAGAGSGKTRVITEKIAYLIGKGIAARNIVAITFTNKAAREMQARIAKLIDPGKSRGLRVSTFHSFGLEVLRAEHKILKLKSSISIYDEHDRSGLVSDLVAEAGGKADPNLSATTLTRISQWKNRFIGPEQANEIAAPEDALAVEIYLNYTRKLEAFNAVDFDDLIFKPVQLFKSEPEILEKWQSRIRHLLVDEYQDTNLTQYQLVRLLTGQLGRFTIVGDDDQSIYAWRGAHPENLASLKHDYPRLKIIKLEQNYRSSGRILKAANRLIENNPHVFEKKLWSTHGPGETLKILAHRDEIAEAQQVASEIIHHRFRHGSRYSDYAILYRGNHQSRPIEKALREHNIPYLISGGSSFFDAAEIKDMLAYLRLALNPEDDRAFLRIVNVPRREIGSATLEKLGRYANQRRIPLLHGCTELGLRQSLSAAASERLENFHARIVSLADELTRHEPFSAIDGFIEEIQYERWLRESSPSPTSAKRKLANVQELVAWLKNLSGNGNEQLSPAETLQKIQLLEILERNEQEIAEDRVQLMTLHSAKGLEFPFVHLVGVEENLLPHQSSIESGDIEEERRLAYVGITRAGKKLTLHYCKHRKRFGGLEASTPSRFLDELPLEDVEWSARKSTDPETSKETAKATFAQLRNLLDG